MTDKALLEAAAKAAGLHIEYWAQDDYPVVRDGDKKVGWNPLRFDSDALRLAVALGMSLVVCRNPDETWCSVGLTEGLREGHKSDPCAATRRAIVRAAAAMVKP